MKGYPRKTCKKAKAASLSLLCHSEDGLGALCEGVGGETCYPVAHKLRRPGRGFCGDPQIGDAGEITIVSSSARRALQASLIFGTPCRPGGFGKHGQHAANRLLVSELELADLAARRPPDLEGDAPHAAQDQDAVEAVPEDKKCRPEADNAKVDGGVPAAGTATVARTERGFWGRLRSRLQRGSCCFEPRTTSTGASGESGGGRAD